MNNNNKITPPPELVQQWHNEAVEGFRGTGIYAHDIATQAARWGADQELEACIEWLWKHQYDIASVSIRAARRPKPPSLAAEALAKIDVILSDPRNSTLRGELEALELSRRALKWLQELENNG